MKKVPFFHPFSSIRIWMLLNENVMPGIAKPLQQPASKMSPTMSQYLCPVFFNFVPGFTCVTNRKQQDSTFRQVIKDIAVSIFTTFLSFSSITLGEVSRIVSIPMDRPMQQGTEASSQQPGDFLEVVLSVSFKPSALLEADI